MQGRWRREFPVDAGEKEAANEHRGLYRIADNFFRFWYSFVFPNLPELESGDAAGVWRHIVEPALGAFVSIPFEEVCRQWLRERNRADALPFHFTKLGRWWRDGDEIDIAAFGRKAVLLGECKYRRRPFRLSDLREFEGKSVPGTEGWETHRYVFSRSGFSADARAAAAGGRFVAVGTEDLFR